MKVHKAIHGGDDAPPDSLSLSSIASLAAAVRHPLPLPLPAVAPQQHLHSTGLGSSPLISSSCRARPSRVAAVRRKALVLGDTGRRSEATDGESAWAYSGREDSVDDRGEERAVGGGAASMSGHLKWEREGNERRETGSCRSAN